MSTVSIDETLANYTADTASVRLTGAIFKAIPFAPAQPGYSTVAGALDALAADAPPAARAGLKAAADSEEIQNVLWMAGILDKGDSAYAAFTGLKAMWGLFTGKGASAALENDDQQRNDAVFKAIGLSYMAWHAFPGTAKEKVAALRASPAGQALLVYWAAVEVAVPFADNAAVAGADGLSRLLKSEALQTQIGRLSGLASGASFDGAREMLASLTAPLQEYTTAAGQYVRPIAESAQKHIPTAVTAADKVAGMVATAADMMPVYTYLGARLAAEGAVARAVRAANGQA